MNKRTIITIITAVAFIVLIAAGITAFMGMNNTNNNTDDNLQTSDQTDDQQSFSGKTGRNIILSKFDTKFALPERIDVTDVRILYKTTDKYETAVVASKTLPSKLNKDQCGGGTLEMGSFAEITRYKAQDEDSSLQKIGNYYYDVSKGPAASNCYDSASFAKYYGDDIVPAIRTTLQTN